MKAVQMKKFGDPDVLFIGDTPDPVPSEGELLVRVKAFALNRADLLQRKGLYPPPPGASDILGLEMSGEIVATGSKVSEWKAGDRVYALLPGGGYSEFVTIPEGMAIRMPDHLTFEEAAAIPEAFLTAYLNLVWLGSLKKGQHVLVHAGASGVGTAAIQLIREFGAKAFVTAGSEKKIRFCEGLGASSGWNYNEGLFVPWIIEQTEGRGVDLILDFIGGPYFKHNVVSLATEGQLLLIGRLGGGSVRDFDMSFILTRRLQIKATTLRSREPQEKIRLTQQFQEFAWTRLADGRLKPVIDSVFDWNRIAEAHTYMESNANIGKIVVKVQ